MIEEFPEKIHPHSATLLEFTTNEIFSFVIGYRAMLRIEYKVDSYLLACVCDDLSRMDGCYSELSTSNHL